MVTTRRHKCNNHFVTHCVCFCSEIETAFTPFSLFVKAPFSFFPPLVFMPEQHCYSIVTQV